MFLHPCPAILSIAPQDVERSVWIRSLAALMCRTHQLHLYACPGNRDKVRPERLLSELDWLYQEKAIRKQFTSRMLCILAAVQNC